MTIDLRTTLACALALLAIACSTQPTPPIGQDAPTTEPQARQTDQAQATTAPQSDREKAPAQDPAIKQQRSAAVDRVLESTAGREPVRNAVATFYTSRDYTPVWFDESGQARPAVQALLESFSRANREGLAVADYGHDALATRTRQLDGDGQSDAMDPASIAALDTRLSMAFVAYAMDLHRGRVGARNRGSRWHNDLPAVDYAGALARAAQDGDVDAALASLRPPHDGYTLLVKALADYREIVANGGWPTIADGELLSTGMSDPRVPALREHLRITGDLSTRTTGADTPVSNRFDTALADALKQFQRRHGLSADGRLGPNTRAALNVPAERRTRQIEINLERWRWLPADLGDRYIMVNIPDYRLRAFDDSKPALSMNVIVGKSYDDRATPVFSDRMRYVIFRPYWNIPDSIATEEILPEARRDHGYLARKNYQIVPVFGPNAEPMPVTDANLDRVENGGLHLRQTSGPHNSLGLIKFMFPNEYAVYLHDTPADQLFSRTQRDFSHGCVRVQDPAALARFVLEGRPEWEDAARIDRALHEGSRQRVDLAQSIPVYLIYWTAFVSDEGVQFRNDLYSHDDELDAAMRQARNAHTTPTGAI